MYSGTSTRARADRRGSRRGGDDPD